MLVAEQVDGIVLCDPDQRKAEGDCDGVHCTERERHRSEADQARANERQCAEHQHEQAAVRDQEQRDDANRVERADPLRIVLRALLHETDGGARPYEWADIRKALESVAPGEWEAFGRQHNHGTEPLPVAEALASVGLRMTEGANGGVSVEVDPRVEIADIAQVLGLSESTVKRRWNAARLWLLEALSH